MADVFGKHAPKIPYQPIADLLAQYRAARSGQARDRRSRPGNVDQLRRARAGGHRHRGGAQAAGRPQRQPRAAARRRDPREASGLARVPGGSARWSLRSISSSTQSSSPSWRPPSIRRSRWCTRSSTARRCLPASRSSASAATRRTRPRPIRRTISSAPWRAGSRPRACRSATRPPTSPASSAPPAPPAGRRSWSTTTAPIGSTGSRPWNASGSPRTTAPWNTARSAGTRRRC